MKAKGADIIEFWKEWPPGEDVYIDEADFVEEPDGTLYTTTDGFTPGARVEPSGKYDVSGYLGWQGKGAAPAGFVSDLAAVFRRWLKAKTETTFAVTVPKGQEEALKAACAANGWKVTA